MRTPERRDEGCDSGEVVKSDLESVTTRLHHLSILTFTRTSQAPFKQLTVYKHMPYHT